MTIENSVIGPGGDADGMQIGADGVHVLNNEFVGIKQIDEVHTDSLQLFGSSNTVIRGNYFHDFDAAIMAPDNGDHEEITDNVFIADSGGYVQPIQLGSHVGTLFAHNVAKNMEVHVDCQGRATRRARTTSCATMCWSTRVRRACGTSCSQLHITYNLFTSAGRPAGPTP